MSTRAAKKLVLGNCNVPTLRTDIVSIGMDTHCHKVVESNTVRAADDHKLSPQSEFRYFVARNTTSRIVKLALTLLLRSTSEPQFSRQLLSMNLILIIFSAKDLDGCKDHAKDM
jgi:hypothetical protein